MDGIPGEPGPTGGPVSFQLSFHSFILILQRKNYFVLEMCHVTSCAKKEREPNSSLGECGR